MSGDITQCPQCATRFKVTPAQLEAHAGMVRCGRCHHAFNAQDSLEQDEPSPQLALPIGAEPQSEEPVAPEADLIALLEEPTTDAPAAALGETPPPRPRRWPTILLALLLTLALLAQAMYFFRVELAARLSWLKPVLTASCDLLGCTVGLPQHAELISIESSEMTASPQQPGVIALQALLHNRAAYAQDYPSLELTLTDLQDHAIARRIFRPADYLKVAGSETLGIPANRDLDVKLYLDTTDLKPAGYRLFLFYPLH